MLRCSLSFTKIMQRYEKMKNNIICCCGLLLFCAKSNVHLHAGRIFETALVATSGIKRQSSLKRTLKCNMSAMQILYKVQNMLQNKNQF